MNRLKRHRRDVTNHFSVRGYEKNAYGSGETVVLQCSSGILKELSFQGKTLQEKSYPQPINSTEISGLKVEGINLLNTKDKSIKVENERYKQIETCLTVEPSTDYTLAFDYEFNEEPIVEGTKNLRIAGYINEGSGTTRMEGKSFSSYEKGRLVYNFTTKESLSESNKLFFRIPEADSKFTCDMKISNVILVKGKYSNLPYEPYVEPTSFTMPYITLAGIDGFNDLLTVNWKDKSVRALRRVKTAYVKDLLENCTVVENGGYYCAQIQGLPKWKFGTRAYCTHCKQFDADNYINGELCFELSEYNNSNNLYFYNVSVQTLSEFTAWAEENEVMIAYVLDGEENEEIEFNLLKEILPYGVSASIMVENTVGMSAVYYSLQE